MGDAMGGQSLLEWQWSDYSPKHRNRVNLLIHIVAVPLFQAATVALVYGAAARIWWLFGIATACIGVSLVMQGRGHRLEAESPTPFNGPFDFVRRIIAEQWITFPRFVLSGLWYRNLKGSVH